jgi:hypothetical protein
VHDEKLGGGHNPALRTLRSPVPPSSVASGGRAGVLCHVWKLSKTGRFRWDKRKWLFHILWEWWAQSLNLHHDTGVLVDGILPGPHAGASISNRRRPPPTATNSHFYSKEGYPVTWREKSSSTWEEISIKDWNSHPGFPVRPLIQSVVNRYGIFFIRFSRLLVCLDIVFVKS